MKKRIQVTAGKRAQKIVLRIARKTTAETGIPITVVDLLEATATEGINARLSKLFPKEKKLTSLRD